MIWLILCILSSTTIFFVFKSIGKRNISSLPVIVVNYFIASAIGFLVGGEKIDFNRFFHSDWFLLAFLIGVLFILMFFVISKSSREAGISITTVASKMSVVIPISFSIIWDPEDDLGIVKILGIILAVISVILTVYQGKERKLVKASIFFPVLLFIGMGFVDSLVKYSQLKYVNNQELSYFTAILFFISFLTGFIILLFRKKNLKEIVKLPPLSWGIFLGIANFGSIYFLIRAFNYIKPSGKGIDSSIIFGINNTGIVVLSVLIGLVIFQEKLSPVNKAGIALAILAIFIFSIS